MPDNSTRRELISTLQQLCGLKNEDEVIDQALMLLGWGATEASKGLAVASVDAERKVYSEVQTPALNYARTVARRQ
jgi:hypothetical protein